MFQGIRPHKVLGAEFEATTKQQQIEEGKIDPKLATANTAQGDAGTTTDPVLVPIIRSVREDLDNRSNDPARMLTSQKNLKRAKNFYLKS